MVLVLKIPVNRERLRYPRCREACFLSVLDPSLNQTCTTCGLPLGLRAAREGSPPCPRGRSSSLWAQHLTALRPHLLPSGERHTGLAWPPRLPVLSSHLAGTPVGRRPLPREVLRGHALPVCGCVCIWASFGGQQSTGAAQLVWEGLGLPSSPALPPWPGSPQPDPGPATPSRGERGAHPASKVNQEPWKEVPEPLRPVSQALPAPGGSSFPLDSRGCHLYHCFWLVSYQQARLRCPRGAPSLPQASSSPPADLTRRPPPALTPAWRPRRPQALPGLPFFADQEVGRPRPGLAGSRAAPSPS